MFSCCIESYVLKTVMPGQEYFKNLDSDKICFINQLQQIMKQYRFPSLEVIRSGDNFPEFQKKNSVKLTDNKNEHCQTSFVSISMYRGNFIRQE